MLSVAHALAVALARQCPVGAMLKATAGVRDQRGRLHPIAVPAQVLPGRRDFAGLSFLTYLKAKVRPRSIRAGSLLVRVRRASEKRVRITGQKGDVLKNVKKGGCFVTK